MKLEKVNIKSKEDHATITGGAHYHMFTNDLTGEELIERTTAEAHAMQKKPGGALLNPKKPGYTWHYTFGTHEYDTPDGILSIGQYADEGENFVCRLPDTLLHQTYVVDKSKIKNDVIDDKDIEKIKSNTI